MMLVAGLSVGLGWGAARTLYSQNAEPAAAAVAAQAENAAAAAAAAAADDARGVEFHGRWTGTGAFLVRAFRVALDEESTLPGLQVIGWDPAAKQVRSWTFDGTGGFGEETWSRQDETWTIRSKYTLPNGAKAGSVNVLTRLDDDSFTWKSVNRDVNGELQPDIDEFTVVRATPAVEAAPAPAAPAPAAVPGKPATTIPAAPLRPGQPVPGRPGAVVPPGAPAAPARPVVPGTPLRPAAPAAPGVPRPAVPR